MGRLRHEGHLRGLNELAQAGFVAVAEGFSPTVPARLPNSCKMKVPTFPEGSELSAC